MLTSEQIIRFKENLSNLSLVSLLVANTLPLIGVIFLEWDAFAIVFLYWSENVILGVYNILKMASLKVSHPVMHLSKVPTILFFTVHYGMFTVVHGIFVVALFKGNPDPQGRLSSNPFLLNLPWSMYVAFAGLFISHGISFGYNFLYKGEYTKTTLQTLMGQPYGRIIILHIAVLLGAFLTMSLGSPVGVLLILVLLKTIIDVILHLRQHRPKPQTNP